MARKFTVEAELHHAISALCASRNGQRTLIGIAGAPASGKSTLAEQLASQLNESIPAAAGMSGTEGPAIVVPMDGFHMDNRILEKRGDLARKGAPHTFDVVGLQQLLGRLRESETSALAPSFDRLNDLSRNAAIVVEEHHSVVLVEGNYLLLNEPIWKELPALFHATVFVSVSESILRQRLLQRWAHYGLDPVEAENRAEQNDLPNARLVCSHSVDADIVFEPIS